MASDVDMDNLSDLSSLTPLTESSASRSRHSSVRRPPNQSQRSQTLQERLTAPSSAFSGISSESDSDTDSTNTAMVRQVNGYYAQKLRKFNSAKALNNKKLRKKELLKENNWLHWKSRVMRILRSNQRLHQFVLDELPPPDKFSDPDEYDAWYELDQAVLEFIHGSIDSDQLSYIPGGLELNGTADDEQSSADFWDNICSVYESHSYQTLNNLLRVLHRKYATETTNIPQHLAEMQSLRQQLANIEYVLDDHIFNGMIISSLPNSWDIFTTTIHGLHHVGERRKSKRRHWSRRGYVSTVELMIMLKAEFTRRQNAGQLANVDQTYRSNTTNSRPNKKRKHENETQSTNACRVCKYTNHTSDNCKWPKNGGYCLTCERGGHWTKMCQMRRERTAQLQQHQRVPLAPLCMYKL